MNIQLPDLRGEVVHNAPLAPYTTLKIGGPADVLFIPADADDLATFWQWQATQNIPVTILGQGSNILVADAGIRGVVVHLGNTLANVTVNDTEITAQAGATCGKVARAARSASLSGLAFFGGIPGSVGGAVRMNAGAYGGETFQRVKNLEVLNDKGQHHTLTPADLNVVYRNSNLPIGWLVLSATFQLEHGDAAEIKEQMRQVNTNRRTSQPLHLPSSGSWFKNVTTADGTFHKAWQLTDSINARGWQIGDAAVSEQHANFFVNLGDARADDMLELSRRVEKAILEQHGIAMELEVKLLGEHNIEKNSDAGK